MVLLVDGKVMGLLHLTIRGVDVFVEIGHTVEPPNNGHIGDRSLVLCREVVLSRRLSPRGCGFARLVTERALLGGG